MRKHTLLTRIFAATLSLATVIGSTPTAVFAEETAETEAEEQVENQEESQTFVLMVADDGSQSVILPEPIAEEVLENVSEQEETSPEQNIDNEEASAETIEEEAETGDEGTEAASQEENDGDVLDETPVTVVTVGEEEPEADLKTEEAAGIDETALVEEPETMLVKAESETEPAEEILTGESEAEAAEVSLTDEAVTEETPVESESGIKGANNPTAAGDDTLRTVAVETDSTKNTTDYISAKETVTAANGTEIQIILDGVTEANKQNLINAIQSNYGQDSKSIQFNNNLFVDAEKYYSDKDMYDAELCWAAAASDIIWKSGWAKDVENPLTHSNFASEDEILTYYATYFKDAGYNTKDGIKWFFDAISTSQGTPSEGAQLTTSVSEKYTNYSSAKAGTETAAIGLKQIVADNLVAAYTPEKNSVADKLSQISLLENLGTDIVAEVGVSWMNVAENVAERTISGGHAIAAAGLILDTAKEGLDKYVAILLADSDNSISSNTTGLPENPTKATETKSACQNSYTLYYLSRVTAADGKTYWQVNNYSSGDTVGVIDEITTLKTKSAVSDTSSVTEQEGKLDVTSYSDLMVDQIYTRSANNDDIKSTFILDQEDIKLSINIANQGNVATTSTSQKLSNRLEIYKDGQLFKTVNLNYDISKDGKSIDDHKTKKVTWTLNKYLRQAGDYKLVFSLNQSKNGINNIEEAYYLNNVAQTLNITVKEGSSSDIVKGITREQFADNKKLKSSVLADLEEDDWYDEDEWLDDIIDWDTWTDDEIDSFFDYLDYLDYVKYYSISDEDWTDEIDEAYVNDVVAFVNNLMARRNPSCPEAVSTPETPVVKENTSESDDSSANQVQTGASIRTAAMVVSGMEDTIKNAPANGTVSYDTGKIYCMTDYMIKKLAARKDVTTKVSFMYKGVRYVMVIPAKADFSKLLADSSKSYGYFGFASLVPGVKISKAS